MVSKIILGKRIRQLREISGISLQQLAECLGADEDLLEGVEYGDVSMSSSVLDKICGIFCYPREKLLDETQEINPEEVIRFQTAKLSEESFTALSNVNRIFLNQMKMDKWSKEAGS